MKIDTNMYTFLKTHFNLDGIDRTDQNFIEIILLLKERLAILNFFENTNSAVNFFRNVQFTRNFSCFFF